MIKDSKIESEKIYKHIEDFLKPGSSFIVIELMECPDCHGNHIPRIFSPVEPESAEAIIIAVAGRIIETRSAHEHEAIAEAFERAIRCQVSPTTIN